MAIQNF